MKKPGGRWSRGFAVVCGILLLLIPIALLRAGNGYAQSLPEPMAFLALVIAGTLVSEDLTTISVGVMVAQGRTSFLFGVFACFLGIFAGDVMLYLAGRWLGRPALTRAPLKWFLREEAVRRSSEWFTRNGAQVIAISRFVPGMRLPTYFAAGMLGAGFWRFLFYFAIACAVWTPLLVGAAALLGETLTRSIFMPGQHFWLKALLAGLALLFVLRLLVSLATWRGRRSLVARWRRLTHWEFWPMWAVYPPVIAWILWLGLRHRCLTLFTAANPAMPAGGVVGESKIAILNGLTHPASAGFIARAELIPAGSGLDDRLARANAFITQLQLGFPVVLKPDAGERGRDVEIIRGHGALADYLRRHAGRVIIQEYAPGPEFGVFYYRMPAEARGHIFSITEKRFPVLTGDGHSTLEQLILNDRRAVCMAGFYGDRNRDRLSDVPSAGEAVQLVEIGAHSRGTIFLDGTHLKTDALEQTIDRISQGYAGFYFGRYDVRALSVEAMRAGRDFKVIELNGVTSEATSIYDPKNSVFAAWRVMFRQWRIAFAIGAQNRARGHHPVSPRALFRLIKNS
ncbi:MAG: VTT domain-containing protein [Blastocatellia bacterium]